PRSPALRGCSEETKGVTFRLTAPSLGKVICATLTSAALVTLAAGCQGEGYPEDLAYPARTDPLVVGKAERDAIDFDRPGEFPNALFPLLDPADRDKLIVQ